ncbi:phospho-N-acetylmuramoyl-pentapeptide-transferase [Candidatus Methylomirabilis lanthanidiphila]|uniref:Phospho-N-acetylmuramoyl-pentapeptide-transferase n=1 Tax=Candidatus Methylomirabilis lanthanidiphila TaxID=2211376 RepID=A0A564ZGX1_9BACT|nr:phospho-N-acetylmuramoyl-pentapeptide-transferase [Candidatus Methylomirabilis lanthanidiphila]VUZ84157.1 phospho-N-acetylmuramoyl-pentapeptide-transferase [Candidatus Methylomirabilis lanthanidiphila]
MLYHLLFPWHESYTILNVFRYVTFRTAGAILTALLISLLMGPALIRRLQKLQIGQSIRDDGPAGHLRKAGTPTMGGVLILASVFIATLLWANLANRFVWLALFSTVWMGAVGFIDDYLKVVAKNSKGLSARTKLLWQTIPSVLIGLFLYVNPVDAYTTKLAIPFFKHWMPDLGWGYVLFVALVIVGASNAVNLTDGLDGLAIGPVLISAAAYTILAYIAGHANIAHYLQVVFVRGSSELTVFGGAIVGASLGFLWYNTYPAQLFMGDTGSLALGAAVSTLAVLVKSELLLLIVGGVFVAEAISVILQVFSYRTTGRRVFRMAPIHHHYELNGMAEPKIIVRFWIVSFILALLSLTTLKLR